MTVLVKSRVTQLLSRIAMDGRDNEKEWLYFSIYAYYIFQINAAIITPAHLIKNL